MKRRSFDFFDGRISFRKWNGSRVIREFFLSLKALGPSVVSSIKHLDLGPSLLEDATLHGLALALKTLNFLHLESLKFSLSDTANEEGGFITIGRVLGNDYLPRLTSLTVGVKDEQSNDFSRLSSWMALFGAVPLNGLTELETLTLEAFISGIVGKVFFALASLQGRPPVLGNVKTICIMGSVEASDLRNACAALFAPGVLPCLQAFSLDRK